MSPRVKKAAVLAVKLAILCGILEYARRQSQLSDEIVIGARSERAAQILESSHIPSDAGIKLEVLEVHESAGGTPVSYRARAPNGAEIDIVAADVDGSFAAPTHEDRAFTIRPGMRTLFRRLDRGLLALAFAAFGPPLFLMAIRWRLLLRASGVDIPLFILLRLHYMAFFFNTFMPGGAGGDIIKAVYVTRHSAQKTEAATMVLIDRVVGLVGLLLMAGAVVLLDYEEMRAVALPVAAISFALAAGALLYFSAEFRKLIGYEAMIAKLPRSEVFQRVDTALVNLLKKKPKLFAALGLTLALQLLEVLGVWLAGQALGLHHARFVHYLAFVPIGYLFNALPISFGGIGLMEGAYLTLFRDAGVATATQGFMLGVLARLIVVGWSLLGAFSALFPPERAPLPLAGGAPAAESET
jgi:uncharacterized protein (TIRG00374 family)